MSSSIAIPKRKQPRASGSGYAAASSSSSSPYSTWANGASPSYSASSLASTSASPSSASTPSSMARYADRRPSLLGSSLSKSEYTVVNVGSPDGAPRLITCVKTSQGFDWNQDIFLPSYLEYDSSDLEHRPDPVEEIVLSDEEAAAILPK